MSPASDLYEDLADLYGGTEGDLESTPQISNYCIQEDKPHIQSVLLIQENTPDMEFVSLGAMVVALRGVVVDDFPIQIAKMKTRVIQG